jgi:2Fe-2S ferredoxin
MPSLTVTDREGRTSTLEAPAGRSLMQVITQSGFDEVQALCGGNCACATCHVYIAPDQLDRLSAPASDEVDLLDASDHRKPNSRLSCQIKFTAELDGLNISIAPED